MSRPFRLALPSKGRLHAPALELARAAGVEVEVNGRALHAHCSRWDIEVLFARADDIPAWTADGAVDAAVAGRDQVVETGADVDELAQLGFGRCALTVAVPEDGPIDRIEQLAAGRVATAHPRTAGAFFAERGIGVETVPIRGSVELAPRLDAAEAIVDLVSSGDTLRQNGLQPIATVLESEATLVARRGLDEGKRRVADELETVVRSVVAARGKRYLMLNAPDAALDEVVSLLPGMDSPTVLPLARGGMHAIHAVVDADAVADLLAPLKAAGARSLLVLPIQHLIP
ncbi:MAG TPA: ATP phosphoribosyltransferase [Gaiellales bacterium]|jgi:ATP phosphoribosyltransferase|nr:ATP phosphoribosyltransferase [Gaiellales bacterium]